jgi:acetate kinase
MQNETEKIILVANPGSSSRKYALYRGTELWVSLHFEYEDGKIICNGRDAEGNERRINQEFDNFTQATLKLKNILVELGALSPAQNIDILTIRVVAPSDYMAEHHVVDEEFLAKIDEVEPKAPLHIPVLAQEIVAFKQSYPKLKIVAVSDSKFHQTKPMVRKYYAIDPNLADKLEIRRYGYHGLSVASIVRTMKNEDILPKKLIVCHVGSGSSVSAVLDGESVDNTMGFSPLEGVMMATRSGSIDVEAALDIKREMGFETDLELSQFLNKKSGFAGMTGNDDMREVLKMREKGDGNAQLAYDLFMYRLQIAIGQMAASLGGVDAVVFTATIGERSTETRTDVMKQLEFLGFKLDEKKNMDGLAGKTVANVGKDISKPIYVIKTNETDEMIRQALDLVG